MNSIDKITRPYIQISDRKSPLNIHRQPVKKLKKKLQAKIKKKCKLKNGIMIPGFLYDIIRRFPAYYIS